MFEEIEAFIHVVELGSFINAAKKLRLSPPVVTRRIAQLETQLAVRLLQRNTRQVTITEAGSLFYVACTDMFNTYNNAVEQLNNVSQNLTGLLKVGLPASIYHLYVTPALPAFLKQHPGLTLEIVQGNHLVDLLSNGFDLIIHCGPLPDSNLYSKNLATWSKITCASPEYLRQHKLPIKLADLAQHNCLDHVDNYARSWSYQVNKKTESIRVQGNIRMDSSIGLKNAAVAGMGIAYLPSFTVKKELATGTLMPLLTSYQPPDLNMYAIYPTKKFVNQKTKAFIEFLHSLNLA